MATQNHNLIATSSYGSHLRFRPKSPLVTYKLRAGSVDAAKEVLPGTPLFYDSAVDQLVTAADLTGAADINDAANGVEGIDGTAPTLRFAGFLWDRKVTMPADNDDILVNVMVDGTFDVRDVQSALGDGTAIGGGAADTLAFFATYAIQVQLRTMGFKTEGIHDAYKG